MLRCFAGSIGRPFLVATLLLSAPLLAQDDLAKLEQGIEHFTSGDYVAAQEVLVSVDREALGDVDQVRRDDYLNRVQIALTMVEKALRDLEDAETALAEGEDSQARQLLESVLGNEYAAEALRQAATAHLRDIEDGAPAKAPQLAAPVNGQRAKVLTSRGDEAVATGEYAEARALYEAALSAVPGYPEAVEGLNRVAAHERNLAGSGPESLIETIRRQNRISWQRAVAQYRDVETVVRTNVASDRYEEALQLLLRARQIVVSGKQFADPVIKYESLFDELTGLETFVRDSERAFNEQRVSQITREVEAQRRKRLQEIEQKRSRQVATLMEQARQHRKDGDLTAAINVLRQVRVIDPKYLPARWMMNDLDDLRQYRRGRQIREDFYRSSRDALNLVEEAKIPWASESAKYPDDWAERISRPGRNPSGATSRNLRFSAALENRIPVDYQNDPFGTVIERLAEEHRLNIIVNWADLKKEGVGPDAAINLSLPHEISLKKALTEVLVQAGGGTVELAYEISEEAIEIATKRTLDQKTFTAIYDINDLLFEVPMFANAPVMDLAMANRRRARLSAQTIPSPWGKHIDEDEPEEDLRRAGRVRKLIDLIQVTVEPDSWFDRGGTIGRIEEFNGQLVVTQNSATQGQVADLLGQLRRQRAVQIAVEARFLTVTSNFLEEFGIDLDIVLNAGNAGFDYVDSGSGALRDPVLGNTLLLPRTFSRLGFTPNIPNLGTELTQSPTAGVRQPYGQPQFIPRAGGGGGSNLTPVPLINQVTRFTNPGSLVSDIAGSFAGSTIGPAFSLFGSYLDNIQVDFLIRATQADARSTVLTAPQLVLFDGQRSFVAVTIQQNYVSQLNPVVGTGAVAVAPQTDTVSSGAVLDVEATVTSDKRYVTMTLRPGLTRLLRMDQFEFSGGAAGGGFGGGAAANAFIQLPTVSSQLIQTTVSVPDGGTLLLGGQKLATETEVESGVPILSKIPLLKRLYSSRTMVKDEQTLLILVRPKILIQSEQEELAFPGFGS